MSKESKLINFIDKEMVIYALEKTNGDVELAINNLYWFILDKLKLEDSSNLRNICDKRIKGLISYLERTKQL